MKKVVAWTLVVGMLATPLGAFAQQNPGNRTNIPNHPRVNQVNQRVKNQHNRIEQGIKSGKINKQQAHQLHQERRAIKTEERAMRKADKGHLTKQDQKILNRQLNKRSTQIYKEKHPNK